jgi:hypothetical protein
MRVRTPNRVSGALSGTSTTAPRSSLAEARSAVINPLRQQVTATHSQRLIYALSRFFAGLDGDVEEVSIPREEPGGFNCEPLKAAGGH